MPRASARTAPAILASGGIVVAAMLVLGLADYNATREMGLILALGIVVMMAGGLTLMPALLAAFGRRAFWPAIPKVEPVAARSAPAGSGSPRSCAAVRGALARLRAAADARRAGQPRGPRLPGPLRAVPRPARVRPGQELIRQALRRRDASRRWTS